MCIVTEPDVTEPDVIVDDYGSIVGITPMTPAARKWIDENCQAEPWQWLGLTLHVDYRLADAVLAGMSEDGLTIN